MIQLSNYNNKQIIELEKKNVEIRELLEDCRSLFELDAERKGLKLTLNVDETVPQEIEQDPVVLSQLICIQLSNSMKYTQEGNISICIKYEWGGETGNLIIVITDTGIGIAEEDQKHLFKMYSAGYNQNTEFGTGVGLTLSQAIVHSMNGHISLNSVCEQGTQISIRIPCRPAVPMFSHSPSIISFSENSLDMLSIQDGINFEPYQINPRISMFPSTSLLPSFPQTPIDARSEDIQIGIISNVDKLEEIKIEGEMKIEKMEECGCPKILIVDDVPSNLFILKEMLKLLNLKSDQACNGVEAIKKVKEGLRATCCKGYKLVFMDCNMPVMDG